MRCCIAVDQRRPLGVIEVGQHFDVEAEGAGVGAAASAPLPSDPPLVQSSSIVRPKRSEPVAAPCSLNASTSWSSTWLFHSEQARRPCASDERAASERAAPCIAQNIRGAARAPQPFRSVSRRRMRRQTGDAGGEHGAIDLAVGNPALILTRLLRALSPMSHYPVGLELKHSTLTPSITDAARATVGAVLGESWKPVGAAQCCTPLRVARDAHLRALQR